jgi:hypothetical protein
MRRWLSLAGGVALGAACAGAPPVPAERFTNAEAEMKAAEEIGAANNPQGKLHLQQAHDQLDAAKKLSKDKPEVAVRKLDSAQAEAELAKSITREQSARSEADEAKSRLVSAQKDLKGTGGGQ